MIYWIILIASVAAGIPLCSKKCKFGREIYCFLVWAVLTFVSAVRYDVGHDYNQYGKWYMSYQRLSVDELKYVQQEKGFIIPTKLLSEVESWYQPMFIIIAVLLITAIMLYIYKCSDKPYLSVFFFLTFGLFFNSLNFMRQMLAALIILYSFRYIRNKQFLRFLVLVLLASSIHVSVLVLIPFYFILRIKMDWFTLGLYGGVTVLILIFSNYILEIVTEIAYKEYDPATTVHLTKGTNPIYAVFFAVFFLLAFLFRKKLCEKDSHNNLLLNCMFFTMFFEIIGMKHAVISRFAIFFFIPAVVILLPKVTMLLLEKCAEYFKGEKTRANLLKTIATVIVFGYCTFMYGYMIENDYNGVSPYKTIFEKVQAKDD